MYFSFSFLRFHHVKKLWIALLLKGAMQINLIKLDGTNNAFHFFSVLQDYDDVKVVVLHKEVGVGLGFSLAGGVDQNKPITVRNYPFFTFTQNNY